MNRLRQFWHATDKLFDLPRRLRAVRDQHTNPDISAGVLTTSLFLGAVVRVPSFLPLKAETRRPGWQRLIGRSKAISDDAFGYGLEHARLEDLRAVLAAVNQTLKRNKALEAAKINGLLGGNKRIKEKHNSWRWLASKELDAYSSRVIWQIGHRRWGIENHAFNELTQHYHLEHCPHHHPVAIIAWLLILVLAFNVFEWFSRLHGKPWRSEQTTLQEIARQLFLALACWEELEPLWSG